MTTARIVHRLYTHLLVGLGLLILAPLAALAADGVDGEGLPDYLHIALFPVPLGVVLGQETAIEGTDVLALAASIPTASDPIVLIVDARNANRTWTPGTDPILAVFSGTDAWVDLCFDAGQPACGRFTQVSSVQAALAILQTHLQPTLHM